VSTALSAALWQSIGNTRSRAARRMLIGLGVVVGLSFVLPATALMPQAADAHAAACSGWTSTANPPQTIRVLRHRTGRVVTVNFQRYVVTVMGKEWPSYLPFQVLEAGAVAVKQYGWYHALQGHQRISRRGECYDVIDTTRDQLYKPHKARVRPIHRRAVAATWATTLIKSGKFFMTGYRRGDKRRCGRDATGYKLFARSATRCAHGGHDWLSILQIYYGPRLQIRS
jgi:Stage II sporulation protein